MKPGAMTFAASIHDLRRGTIDTRGDAQDRVAAHGNVTLISGRASAVYDTRVLDEEIDSVCLRRSRLRSGEQEYSCGKCRGE